MKVLSFLVLSFLLGFASAVSWQNEPATGDLPGPRGGGQLSVVGNKGVYFGGFLECFNVSAGCDHYYYPEVHVLNFDTLVWKMQPVTGNMPGERSFHGQDAYKKSVIVFGGIKYNVDVTEVTIYEDMWSYDHKTNTWTEITFTNEGPGPRLGMQILVIGDLLYAFGGFNESFLPNNDIWSFDLKTNTWNELLPATNAATSPGPRFIYQWQYFEPQNRLYIFGGNNRDGGPVGTTTQYNDTWAYNIDTNTFTQIVSMQQTSIGGRTHAASTIAGDTFVIALGDAGEGCQTNEPSSGQDPTNTVVQLNLDKSNANWKDVGIGFTIAPTKRVAGATYNNKLWVTGGFGYTCVVPTASTALWNLYTFSLPLGPIS